MEYALAIGSAFWFGILTSISPCPLATNIAAISFVGRKIGSAPAVLAAGVLYACGRTIAYASLGILLAGGLTAAPEVSHLLQKYMNLLMGPLLILVAMVLLKLLTLPAISGGIGERLWIRVERMGIAGAGLLGIIFALSFCPTSAVLFFGSLLPLAIKFNSGLLLPAIYGMATGLPVLFFAFLLAFGVNQFGRTYHRLAMFELWAQRITGIIFLLIGLYFTFAVTMGITI
ncbi:aromatic aminobenezylarsenical efflux permease ArsG family transporter [Victivallis vadensis]|uniref:aromatic aminobenezylarsenical efflux permease ArsG family transporter n=1 Tax=Victivallis vadensis TaxID=172901 RepID=UPI0023F15777|nr:aromatic aminobenezylarsenical efflux permease ArsG family transporter [Victivallis vadensis]